MTDWIEHDGGPQPVADDVMVEVCATVDYTVNLDDGLQLSQFAPWARKFKYRILNQHLIDAKQAEIDALRDDLETWQSVFPHVMPDRLKSDQQLADEDVAAKIDAARLEGIRLGLEAAARTSVEWCVMPADFDEALRALDPDTIAREATLDTLTAEAQAQGMGYDNDDAKKARERERKREVLRELTKLTEEFGGYEELKGDNEETAR